MSNEEALELALYLKGLEEEINRASSLIKEYIAKYNSGDYLLTEAQEILANTKFKENE